MRRTTPRREFASLGTGSPCGEFAAGPRSCGPVLVQANREEEASRTGSTGRRSRTSAAARFELIESVSIPKLLADVVELRLRHMKASGSNRRYVRTPAKPGCRRGLGWTCRVTRTPRFACGDRAWRAALDRWPALGGHPGTFSRTTTQSTFTRSLRGCHLWSPGVTSSQAESATRVT
jgi:hypothetical protein